MGVGERGSGVVKFRRAWAGCVRVGVRVGAWVGGWVRVGLGGVLVMLLVFGELLRGFCAWWTRTRSA